MSARLNRYVAASSGYSRRKADALIISGNVRVNKVVVNQPYYRLSETDAVSLYGKPIVPEKLFHLALNKPPDYTCTCADPYASKKTADLLPGNFRHLYPVGRLDKNSRGLLFLTNDGNFCFRVTHPGFEVDKEYRIKITPRLAEKDLRRLKQKKGIIVQGSLYRVKDISVERQAPDLSCLKIVVCEGKKRHIRIIFSSLGYRVLDLQRVRIGSVELGNLKEGTYRFLSRQEVNAFR